ncbi:hypothetical protein [Moorena producens]
MVTEGINQVSRVGNSGIGNRESGVGNRESGVGILVKLQAKRYNWLIRV